MSAALSGMDAGAPTMAGRLRLIIAILLVVLIAESIGTVTLGSATNKIVLQPMLWAIFIGAIIAAFAKRIPSSIGLDARLQTHLGGYLSFALLPFLAKLGLMVGGNLPKVQAAGWALVFQEFGHFFGTMAIGLPLALLLGIKREAIGATFSVGREPSLAIISEKFGMNSPEGRGVMAEYITGTVLGALFIALLANFITNLGIFDPRSLAMGAGVGSGSMMAAGVAAISSHVTPEVAAEVVALAGAANLLTTVFGVYFTLFISLPTTIWLYGKLEPVLGRFMKPATASEDLSAMDTSASSHAAPSLGYVDRLVAWFACGLLTLIGNQFGYKVPILDALPGALIIIGIVMISDALWRLSGKKVPIVLILSAIAMVAGCPGLLPYSDQTIAWVNKVNFLPFTTVILAMAGLSILKDLPAFRRLGWKIIVVSLAASTGTFLGATVIAEFFH